MGSGPLGGVMIPTAVDASMSESVMIEPDTTAITRSMMGAAKEAAESTTKSVSGAVTRNVARHPSHARSTLPIARRTLERLSDTDVKRGERLALSRREIAPPRLEPEVEPDRPERRSQPHPDAGREPHLAEIERLHSPEHVAGVDESDDAHIAPHRGPQLSVQDDHRVAAARESLRRDGLGRAERVEREAADRCAAAREEALARGQVRKRVAIRLDRRRTGEGV